MSRNFDPKGERPKSLEFLESLSLAALAAARHDQSRWTLFLLATFIRRTI